MDLSKLNDTALDVFLRYVTNNPTFEGMNFNYFHPFQEKNTRYITVQDRDRGYAVLIPFPLHRIPLINETILENTFHKTLKSLELMREKTEGEPARDYKTEPLKAHNSLSIFERTFGNDKITVDIYSWSKIKVK